MKINKRVRYEIISIILIFLVGGFIQTYLFCDNCSRDWDLFMKNALVAGFVWTSLWKGSEISFDVLDRWIDWLEAPLKRLFVSLASMVLVVIVGFWGSYLLVLSGIYGTPLDQALEYISAKETIPPIIITFAINSFMHGRGFLLSWRADAVKYEKLKTEQIATQFNSLRNQVNPHFLFNSLNALSSLVYDDQDKAVEFIRKLSQVYRYVLDTKDKEVVTLEEEMDFLNSYIYLQKIRFDESLVININLESNVMHHFVVPISLQMLLENAIKHNIISESKKLTIDIFHDEEYLYVSNNLQEKIHKDSTGIGLENIKSRYEYFSTKEVIVEKTDKVFKVGIPIVKSQ
ncbi:MAG: histidine kinase [bacterium]|nr:histidine kinase [bacterium]